MSWASRADVAASSAWVPPAGLGDTELDELLEVATEALEPFAPAVKLDEAGQPIIPARYKRACILHAREIYLAAKRDGDVVAGTDSYVVLARDLSAVVRGILRPRRGKPGVG